MSFGIQNFFGKWAAECSPRETNKFDNLGIKPMLSMTKNPRFDNLTT